jgi:DNA-binding transcriptional regulator GbsR (MarR family)
MNKQKWEEEFDKEFILKTTKDYYYTTKSLKQFISKLLKQQKERADDHFASVLKDLEMECVGEKNEPYILGFSNGYNQKRKEVQEVFKKHNQ